MDNKITVITRRKIFREIQYQNYNLFGELDQIDFLKRIFILDQIESYDSRFDNMEQDILQHTINNNDWDEDWYLNDTRLNILNCDDEIFLKLLEESLHPEVRIELEETINLVQMYNNLLINDNFQLKKINDISGHPVFKGVEAIIKEKEISNNIGIFKDEINEDELKAIWGVNYKNRYRLFISHKHTIEKECKLLKEYLLRFNIECFVAHDNTEVNSEWQISIENALQTCDGLLAILTNDFYDSDWTEQEIGCAIGRKIDIFSLSIGNMPRGFISKYQAIKKVKYISSHELILSEICNKSGIFKSIISSLTTSSDYDFYNEVYEIISKRITLRTEEAELLVETFNNNNYLFDSKKFGGPKGCYLREKTGLVELLINKTGIDYSNQIILK